MAYSKRLNEIFRDDVLVARIDPETGALDYEPDMDRYRAPVTQFLREQGGNRPPVVPAEMVARITGVKRAGAEPEAPEHTPVGDGVTDDTKAIQASMIAPDHFAEITSLRAQLAAKDVELIEQRRIIAALRANTGAADIITAPPKTVAFPDLKTRSYAEEGAPEMDPALGDKTPAFVDWMHTHHPEEAAKRYLGRKTHRN